MPVALYLRVSTPHQQDNHSLPEQERLGRAFAESIGERWVIYKEAKSGSTMVGRLQMQKLLEDIERGLIDKVWIVDQDRLGRELGDLTAIRKTFQKYNVQLHIGNALIDLKSRAALLLFNVKATIAEDQRLYILETTGRGITDKINKGDRVLPHVLGYKRVWDSAGNSKWVVDLDEAKIVKIIFEQYLQGKTLYYIGQNLNRLGYRTKRGKDWEHTTVSNVLHRLEYTGRTRNKEGAILKSTVYEPIIEFEHWKAVNENWKSHAPRPLKQAKWLASALVKCRQCGQLYKYYGNQNKNGRRYPQYEARHLPGCVNRGNFKAILIERVLEVSYFLMMENEEAVFHLMDEKRRAVQEANKNANERRTQYSKRIQTLKKQQANLLDAVAEGSLTADVIRDKMDAIKSERAQLELELKEVTASVTNDELSLQQLEHRFSSAMMKAYNNETNDGNKRKILKDLLQEAWIDKGRIHIAYKNGWVEDLDLKNLPAAYGNEIVAPGQTLYEAIRDKRFGHGRQKPR